MTNRLLAGVLLAATSCVSATVAAQETSPDDFAYAVPINSVGQDALYRIVISRPVYEGASFSDLRDLRVFNSAGEVVPHAFRPVKKIETRHPAPVYLPIFELVGPLESTNNDIDITVNASDMKFSLNANSSRQGREREVLLGYLIDVSDTDDAFTKLFLEWDPPPLGYVGAVNVDASKDLKSWQRVASNAPLVSLAQRGQRLDRNHVNLRRIESDYLRLTWPTGTSPIALRSILGQHAERATPHDRVWLETYASRDDDQHSDYLVDLGGTFPVDRMEIGLPQENSVAPILILARNEPDEAWSRVRKTVAYRLRQNNQNIASPDIAINGVMRRYWLFRIEQQGGGIGEGDLQVRAGWIAREIVFAARGDGPFLLAYGNSKALANALTIHTLVPGWGSETEPEMSLLTTGTEQTLGGAARAGKHIDAKKVALWAALLAAVAVLGFMAWRLSRQLQDPANARPATPPTE